MHITAIIFDWAGTVVDHGSRAPTATLQEVFAEAGVPIMPREARLSMGIAKRAHIAAILALPRVTAEWQSLHGSPPTEADLDCLYARFVPRQMACLERYSDVITGVPAAVAELRGRGLKIGSTTGYTVAKRQGFSPDCAICPEDVPGGGRPAPWMCYLNGIRLAVSPLSSMIKIGDTPSDVAEGLNAGMWTIGITRTGNEVGMTASEWESASANDRSDALVNATIHFREAGSHYVAESVSDCPGIVDEIEMRVAHGDRP
jgi:phosphonoacetaldehyde hydrolase